jgi:hypothetical protein
VGWAFFSSCGCAWRGVTYMHTFVQFVTSAKMVTGEATASMHNRADLSSYQVGLMERDGP